MPWNIIYNQLNENNCVYMEKPKNYEQSYSKGQLLNQNTILFHNKSKSWNEDFDRDDQICYIYAWIFGHFFRGLNQSF